MGHKGVSKRKPKKSGPFSGVEISSSSNGRSAVQTLVKDKGAPLTQDGMKPSVGSKKTQKKR